MRLSQFLAALAFTTLAPPALLAHVQLAASSPAAGSEVEDFRTITLTFSEPVDPSSAAVSIVMTAMPGVANHGEMAIRNFTPSWSQDNRTLTLTLRRALPEGSYEVRWQAAASDNHPMTGTVAFEVT
ncbi:MAG: copper resistance protein CopC [Porphyrobacter sp.]|nr:copper resistance protein CopC [Porphyrobacter sp.]